MLSASEADWLCRKAAQEGLAPEVLARHLVHSCLVFEFGNPDEVAAVLDSIPGFYERLQQSREQRERGETISFEEWKESWQAGRETDSGA